MPKKKSIFTIKEDVSALFIEETTEKADKPSTVTRSNDRDVDRNNSIDLTGITVKQALETVTRQMTISGNRERTISDYITHVNHFIETTKVHFLDDISANKIYEWLASMNVSNQTKLTRLKCLKAFLSRCFDNGWITQKFWKPINVKVDNKVKEGATDRDVRLLLSLLDMSDFVQLRDAVAVLIMYKCGLRINTLSLLENRHIDFTNNLLKIDGDIVKNRQQILLPFDETLHRLLSILIKYNDDIRKEYGQTNEYVFITRFGAKISTNHSHNNIRKRLNAYAKQYGLKNINPHALRRGFAKNLLDKGANIVEISHALGHSNLAVTTKYLHLDKEEVAENLRKYL